MVKSVSSHNLFNSAKSRIKVITKPYFIFTHLDYRTSHVTVYYFDFDLINKRCVKYEEMKYLCLTKEC